MLKWSEMRRFKDTILAVWPVYKPLYGRWFMQELVNKGEMPPRWRDRYIPGENDGVLITTPTARPQSLRLSR